MTGIGSRKLKHDRGLGRYTRGGRMFCLDPTFDAEEPLYLLRTYRHVDSKGRLY